jgi:hypothetical protein
VVEGEGIKEVSSSRVRGGRGLRAGGGVFLWGVGGRGQEADVLSYVLTPKYVFMLEEYLQGEGKCFFFFA